MDNEAARAALTTGTSEVPGDLLLVYALWAIAAEHDMWLGAERVPAGANPADLASRNNELSFQTEPAIELASLKDLISSYDFSRALPQTGKSPL